MTDFDLYVIPAKAGIQGILAEVWVALFAGMTQIGLVRFLQITEGQAQPTIQPLDLSFLFRLHAAHPISSAARL